MPNRLERPKALITPLYCQTMSRYNTWQNNGLRDVVGQTDAADLSKDRGAFFGSIIGTLNHLLWGDTVWMSRFDGGAGTDLLMAQSRNITPTPAIWASQRIAMDARITLWAQSICADDLYGDLKWFPVGQTEARSTPMGLCATHLFNHQTHHRGQVHAMLTAAGQNMPDTDLPFMPKDM